jgi:hypothetical protein
VEKLTKKAKMTKVFVKGWVASKDKEVAKFKHVFDAMKRLSIRLF